MPKVPRTILRRALLPAPVLELSERVFKELPWVRIIYGHEELICRYGHSTYVGRASGDKAFLPGFKRRAGLHGAAASGSRGRKGAGRAARVGSCLGVIDDRRREV